MSDAQFKVADLVQHAAGGNGMSIESFDKDGNAICSWRDASGKRQTDTFPVSSLKPYKAPTITMGTVERG